MRRPDEMPKSHKKKWVSGRPPKNPTPRRRGPIGTAYKFTAETRATFLAGLADGLSITGAADLVRMTREGIYKVRREEQAAHEAAGGTGLCEFALNWDAAVEAGTDRLEDAGMRRARDGVLEPVFQGGRRVGLIRRYSDSLLPFMLKGRRPEKFKDRVEQTGKDGQPLHPAAPPPLVVNFTKPAPREDVPVKPPEKKEDDKK